MELIILAGGKGTRLASLSKHLPKPMIEVAGKPILEHQIEFATENNISNIIIMTGYLSETIEKFVGNGSRWGLNIECIKEQTPLGTAGCLKQIENRLTNEFIVLYGDLILNIDLESMINFHQKRGGLGTLLVHPNDHPYDSDLLEIDNNNLISKFYSKPHKENKYYQNLVNGGVYILNPRVFKYIEANRNLDFGKDIFPKIVDQNESLNAYYSAEYLKDVGIPERLTLAENDISSGKVRRLNKKNKRKAVFLDRDGVINVEVGYISHTEHFLLLPGVFEAIGLLNKSEYLAILVTNQPVVARGECGIDDLKNIHNKLETLLGREGVYLDRIYFCPHHPDIGFKGERLEYKIKCDCRKPSIGMFIKAVEEYNIELESSYVIGDSTVDIQAGRNAGVKTILVKTGLAGKDKKYNVLPDVVEETVFYAVRKLMGI